MATGLTKSYVLPIFNYLTSGDTTSFFDNVVDDVDWLVTGDLESHPLAGRWHSKTQYFQDTWTRVGARLQKPMQLSIVSVFVEATGPALKGTAVVELNGLGGVLKSGKEYNNEYCWVVGFNEEGKIASVRAYLDTAKLRDALQ